MHAVATTWPLDATNRSMEKPPKSDLVGKLAAELEVLEAMEYSAALEALCAEKRQQLQRLQATNIAALESASQEAVHVKGAPHAAMIQAFNATKRSMDVDTVATTATQVSVAQL